MTIEPSEGRQTHRSQTSARTLFGLLALADAAIGGWAEVAPGSFYRSFPGFGRHWLPPLGPYNEHLIRDFGALNLGLAAAALVAAIVLGAAAWTAAAAWIVYSLPHLVFHAIHTDPYGTFDNIANLVVLSTALVVPAVALWLATNRARI
jgi:hypothetical protein